MTADEYARSQGQQKTTAPDGTVFVHHANLTGMVTIVLAGGWAHVSGNDLLYLVNGPTLAERYRADHQCEFVNMGIRCELVKNHPADEPHSASPKSVLTAVETPIVRKVLTANDLRTAVEVMLDPPDFMTAHTPIAPRVCPCDSVSEARCETSEGWRCHNCATKIAARTGEWIADGNKVIMGANNSAYCEGGEDDYAAALEIVRTRRMAGLQK